jgi:ribonuclease BN (tRNA processing enzyme)
VRLDDGTLLILDAGTGIRPLGLTLAGRDEPLHLLLTHLHLDHLEGLGFFLPIWDRQSHVHIWGPASPLRSLEERIARYLSPPLFPIDLSHIPAQLTFHDVRDEPWKIGDATIEAWPVVHPGPTVGYRLEGDGAVLAYIPDHEPALGGLDGHASEWVSGVAVALGADVLLHDAQFVEAEYAQRVGWGHSSVADAVTFARLVAVERLILFHHDPLHTDDNLDELGARALELWKGNGPAPELAREGATIELAPHRSSLSQV